MSNFAQCPDYCNKRMRMRVRHRRTDGRRIEYLMECCILENKVRCDSFVQSV